MNRIKELRTREKCTQKELADLLGITSMTISRWEKEENPAIKHEQAQTLANHFGVSVPYLLGHDELETTLKERESLLLANLEVNKSVAYESVKLFQNTISSILELLDLLKNKAKSGNLKTEVLIDTIETLENFTTSLDKTIQTTIDSQIKHIELNRLIRELENSKETNNIK